MQENGGFLSFTQEGCRKELLFLLQTPPPHFLCMNDSLYSLKGRRVGVHIYSHVGSNILNRNAHFDVNDARAGCCLSVNKENSDLLCGRQAWLRLCPSRLSSLQLTGTHMSGSSCHGSGQV